MLVRTWVKGSPRALWVGMQTGAAAAENSAEVPRNVADGTTGWPSDPTFI